MAARLALAGVLLIAASCSCPSRPGPGEDLVDGERDAAKYRFSTVQLAERALRPFARAPSPRLKVLILSGGGQHGAFGAGILDKWRRAQGRLDIVTGVSTGALQATAAFLGSEEQLANLVEAYTTVDEEDVIEERSWLRVPFSNSLATTHGLRDLIDTYVSDEVLEQVRKHASQGGIIAVGTTNLDSGAFVVWDLTAMARDRKYDLYRKVVMASSSMPVFMTPVFINGEMHGDGGVREQLFIRDLANTFHALRRRAPGQPSAGRPAEEPPDMDVSVIVNGSLCARARKLDNCLLSIAKRSLDLVLTEAAIGNLYKTQALLAEMKRSDGIHYRMAAIPHDFTVVPESEFDRAYMNALLKRGQRFAERNEWYDDLVPRCPDPGRRRM